MSLVAIDRPIKLLLGLSTNIIGRHISYLRIRGQGRQEGGEHCQGSVPFPPPGD